MKDWTCPHCGAIVDRYLFSTVTLKSLEGEGRNAYLAGYQDCMTQARAGGTRAVRPETYRPHPGQETAYRAGWQRAADKVAAKADRKFGRRRGIKVFGSGVTLLLLGLGVAYGTQGITNAISLLIFKGRVWLLALAQLQPFLINLSPLVFEHHDPRPAQFLDRAQKGTLGIPPIDRDEVKEAHPIDPAHPAQQAQGGRAFLFSRKDRLYIEHEIDFGAVNLGDDVAMVILNDFMLLPLGVGFLDLALTALLATTAAAFEVFVGIQAQAQ